MTIHHSEVDINFEGQSAQLAGTLSYPQKAGPFPAIIMLHGSGPADRTNGGYFLPLQQLFLSLGIAVLCYDKPGVGQSSGDWKNQSFEDRADEAIAAVQFLQVNPNINSQKIGLWGHSQGAWIVFLAAAKSKEIAFVIANSGSGVSPFEQDQFGIEHTSRAAGEADSDIMQTLTLYRAVADATRRNKPYEDIAKLYQTAPNALLQQYLNLDEAHWAFWKEIVDYDPIPALNDTACPVLALFGGQDLLVPVEESMAIYRRELINAADIEIKRFPKAKHRITNDESGSTKPSYFETISSWLEKQLA